MKRMHARPTGAAAVAAVAVAVLAAGCGAPKGAGSAASTTSSTTTTVKGPVDAVALRARLTGLLQGSVYLTGFSTGAVLNGTDPGPATTALETNSTRLQDTLTGVIGPALGAQFGALWRQHVALFVTYARAKAAADQAGTAKTLADLDQVRANAADLLDRATHGQLAKEAMSDELKPHVSSVVSAINAQATKDPAVSDKLKTAADRMPSTADVLAAGLSKTRPDLVSGDSISAAASLRASLTAAFETHVYLAGLASGTVLAGRDPKPAVATLDKSSAALGDAVGSVYGDARAKQFLALWRAQTGYLIDDAAAHAARDAAKVKQAGANLDRFAADLGSVLADATHDGLSSQAAAADLVDHVSTMESVVDAQAGNDPSQYAKLELAADHIQGLADSLASAIVTQFSSTFS